MYYNESKLNKADGVIVYIKKGIINETKIIKLNKLSIINTCIELNFNNKLYISSLYRSHGISKTEFIHNLKIFLKDMNKCKNHFIIGDFNIDIIKNDIYTQEFHNNFLEMGYLPAYQNITRPSTTNNIDGNCIDNMFHKTDTLDIQSFTIKNSISDIIL